MMRGRMPREMHRRILSLMAVACVAGLALATPAQAEKAEKAGKQNAAKSAHGQGVARGQEPFCPPGLAKKNPPCVPPGLARKSARAEADPLKIGEVIDREDWDPILDPRDYGLLDGPYVRYGDHIYRINEETGRILAVIGLIDALTN